MWSSPGPSTCSLLLCNLRSPGNHVQIHGIQNVSKRTHEPFNNQLRFSEIQAALANLANLPNISANYSQTERMRGWHMVTHLSINHGLRCLTSVIWQFTITAFTFGACCKNANVSHFQDGWAVNFGGVGFSTNLNASIMHNTKKSQQWGQWGWMVRTLKLSNQDHG